MKKLIINISILLMYSALCFASSPKWLTDLEKAFPAVDYIRAVGEGNSESSAKKSALSELSSYFNQTISSQTQALRCIEQDNSSYKEKGEVKQNLIASTKSDLFSVQYTRSVYDKRTEKFYICAYLVRKDVWDVISQKMDVVMNNCKSSLNQINKETEILNQLIQLNRTERLYSDFIRCMRWLLQYILTDVQNMQHLQRRLSLNCQYYFQSGHKQRLKLL